METPTDPDCYWVEPGRLLAGEYPGSSDEATARAKLRALLDCGIRVFVDLTEETDGLEPYEDLLREDAAALGLDVAYRRMPVRDMDVPSGAEMRAILDTLRAAVDGGTPAYVHCWGGVGRTGTVVSCWLAERGLGDKDVFSALAKLRKRCGKARRPSPETRAQEQFVRAWCDRGSERKSGTPG